MSQIENAPAIDILKLDELLKDSVVAAEPKNIDLWTQLEDPKAVEWHYWDLKRQNIKLNAGALRLEQKLRDNTRRINAILHHRQDLAIGYLDEATLARVMNHELTAADVLNNSR